MAKSIKVRFNLGRGPNYLKWKVEWPDKRIEYYRPCEVQLIMQYCRLKNSRKLATRIFLGEHKTVCAWVLCQNIAIQRHHFIRDESHKIRYNPKEAPYWQDKEGRNIDGSEYDHLHTIDYGIYLSR